MDTLLAWLTHYGYAGLFGLLILGIVGVPVPDETLLVFSGYLISKGQFRPEWTFAAAFLGSACGISLSYVIGRTAGYRAARRFGKYVHLTEQRLDQVHTWFCRMGEWLLTLGYFVPGVRHCTALVAGMSKLEYRKFAFFAYLGAAIWTATFLTIGYFVGENWRTVLQLLHRYTLWSILVLVLLAAPAWWIRARRGKRSADLQRRPV